MSIPAGWYPDPAEPEIQRFWDGEQWTDPRGVRTERLGPSSPPTTSPIPTFLQGQPHGSVFRLASYGSRLAARLIDIAVLFVLNLVVSGWFILQFIDEVAPAIAKSRRSYEVGHFDNVVLSSRAEKLFVVITVISIALWLAYEVPAVLQRGQTLGKRLLGIKVIVLTSHSLRFGTAMRRWAVMGLSLLFPLACSAIWLVVDSAWCLINRPTRQCIHDKAAQTVVVDI